jgi:hypothetical protein
MCVATNKRGFQARLAAEHRFAPARTRASESVRLCLCLCVDVHASVPVPACVFVCNLITRETYAHQAGHGLACGNSHGKCCLTHTLFDWHTKNYFHNMPTQRPPSPTLC